jgi:ribosomal-protein-alanine N-acetyltransferase
MAGFKWPVTLECGDLVLRPIRYRDRKEWTEVRSRNSEWLAPWEASNPAPGGGLPDFRQMVRSLKAQAAQATALPFVITERTPGFQQPVIVGQLTVSSIVWGSAMMATLGYWVDKDRAGHGIAPTSVAMVTDYCFSTLGLHRMEINIRPENRPSLHINGEWADHRTFALTSEEVPAGLLARWLQSRPA